MVRSGWFVASRIILAMALAHSCAGSVVTLDDLTLSPQSYWNGADGSGGFVSNGVSFNNSYDAAWFYWEGFSYSNLINAAPADWEAQYAAVPGGGQGGSSNYAVGFVGWATRPTILLPDPQALAGVYVTNNAYAYYDMLDGSDYSKKFGGAVGNDPDWFKLTITGKNADGVVTGVVDFYLADLQPADNSKDYVLNSWAFVDLRSLGQVKTIEFALSSSDTGAFGMNTPGYFCLDSLVIAPPAREPAGPGRPFGRDLAISGYLDAIRGGAIAPSDSNAVINPLFRGWAGAIAEYCPTDDVTSAYRDPTKALGPVTGDSYDTVSLGELTQEKIGQGAAPGRITLIMGDPNDPQNTGAVHNGKGFDFVVFENGFISKYNTPQGSVKGQLLGELAYVEVSSNGRDFVRFPSVSLTPARVGAYGTVDPGNVHNLAGKHANGGVTCTGTPFDLNDVATHPDVLSGKVDLEAIHYVRLVDIPGSGDFLDGATSRIDPNTWPDWAPYAASHPIYDQWPTWDSGGFDLEAIGALNEQQWEADVNLDGRVDADDFDLMVQAWNSHFGDSNWNSRCDVAQPRDFIVDSLDLDVLARQWGCVETWQMAVK